MAVSIGKRKRRDEDVEADQSDDDQAALRARFQRAFEAKFKPLERSRKAVVEGPSTEDDMLSADEESDWSGLSQDEEDVQIVEHGSTAIPDAEHQQHSRKSFMSSRPPESTKEATYTSKQPLKTVDGDSTEAANVKHDLALQRLLKESHLLDSGAFSKAAPTLGGKARLKALDLRLKDLGAKESSAVNQKMPLAHRKGITSKATSREEKRRKDALENGIILETAKHASKAQKHRVRNVGGPTVGKFRGGTLKLSPRDVRSIQGPKQRRSRR